MIKEQDKKIISSMQTFLAYSMKILYSELSDQGKKFFFTEYIDRA